MPSRPASLCRCPVTPGSEVWADDGTTWDTPDVVLSDGPQSTVLSSGDLDYVGRDMPRSGRIGFTVAPGPSA